MSETKTRKRSLDSQNSEELNESCKSVRSGKWSSEEEGYADRLVLEFEKGWLTDCENGCTLRSYLAKKLNCAPMRISKKFAGRCIGKVIFLN